MLLASILFTHKETFDGIYAEIAPLIDPRVYGIIATCVAGSVVSAIYAKLFNDKRAFYASIGCSAAAVLIAIMVPDAGSAGYMGQAYPWGKSILIFVVLLVALAAICHFTPNGWLFFTPVAGLQLAAMILLKAGALNGLTHPMSWYFWWPICWNFALLALTLFLLPNGRSVAGAAFFAQLGVSFYVYMPIVSDLRNPPMNWGYPRTWEGFKHAIMRGQYEAIGIQPFSFEKVLNYFEDVAKQFTWVMALFALIPFAAGHKLVQKANRKIFWQWMGAAVACFLMMSVLLIMLANVKGDVQDGFIQKVKFISSHAMIALWIGYGLIFTAVAITRHPRVSRLTSRVTLALAAIILIITFSIPLIQNYCNDRLVFEMGGNEQNGHTFGWQFGAYQLEGWKAIREQITDDEEPLPDPSYPPPMEDHAIFFGGTDPGRFVPTYMIYSADFRPDVYLITQNALADDTYMSVERDLYGDEIWIPSKEDSAEAFNIYVDEVQRGVRKANGDLQIQNGRVQVTGALGVMEINGILTKMMFDHDRERHAFYVEESYAIPWMYEYLSPHGLIMKINKDRTPYNQAMANQDEDFWDWYTRRLLDDPMYRRDFAGQKSFSKLRAAIAGLYTKQGRYQESAQAFREACLLYPASPEATFRYAQESLMPFRKWDICLELMDYTDKIDPNNKRTANLRNYVLEFRDLYAKVNALNTKRIQKPNEFTATDSFELAYAYYQMGRVGEAAHMMHSLLAATQDPAALRLMAEIFFAGNLAGDAEEALNKFLRLKPNDDFDAWLMLAKLQSRTGRRKPAESSFMMAYRINKEEVFKKLNRDEELYKIAEPLFQRRK